MFFVNKRYIKDKTLSAATEQAYKGLIPIGKFGFVILNIEMNPAKVDVNVHPAKLEVRFQEESKVFQAIYHTIKDTLLKSELVANTEKPSNQIERTAESFEERLKNIRENAKQNEGLFSFRKQREKQIEQYTNEESKIKTNVAEAKPEIKQENMSVEPKTEKIGNPLNTSDILLQLKQMKEKMEEEIKNTSTLKEEKEDYKLENSENDVNGKIDNNEDANADAKLNENNNDNSEEKVNIKTDNNEENTNKEEQENANSKQEENISEEKNGTIDDANAIIENIDDPEIQKEFEEIKGKMQDLNDNPQVVSEDFNEMYAKLFGRVPIQEETENKKQEESTTDAVDIIKDNISVFEGQEEAKKPAYKFIGIVFKTYIILEIDKEMYILDQHAAHERIMYEKVKKNYYSEESKDSQMLLLPDVITLTHKEMDIAKENIKMFEQAGFSLEEFGDNTIKLTGVPTVCIDLDTKELFLETLDEINTVARTAKQEKEEKFIATVACKAAVKANMALTEQEVGSLMEKLLELPNPFTCPHGRPTAIKMTKYDIERKFARK